MTTATKKGFRADCIKCGEAGSVHLYLGDLTTFHCGECDGEFEIDDVRTLLGQWNLVLAWVDAAPNLPD